MLNNPKDPNAPKKPGLFAAKPKKTPVDLTNVYKDINEIGRGLRVLEQKYSNLQNKSQITEQNVISKNKIISNEIKTTNLDMHELKREINQLKDQILVIVKELQSTARKEEVKVLERYLNMWEPIKFVTHNELEDMVKIVLHKIDKEKNINQGTKDPIPKGNQAF